MEFRQALNLVARSGTAPSHSLVGLASSRCIAASRIHPAAATFSRSLSSTPYVLADKPRASRPPLPSLSSKPGSNSPRSRPPFSKPPPQQKDARPAGAPATQDIDDPMDVARSIEIEVDDFISRHIVAKPALPELRLRPSTGRMIHVQGQVDVPRSFQLLNVLVRRNNLPSDVRKQRFYERPGLKRKRLKSVRWRKRFKAGFMSTVDRVRELSRQGW